MQKYARGKAGEELYSILNKLIDISEKQQEKFEKMHFCSSISWAKEFCTIHLQTARQAGHTYALIETAITRFNKSIIISPKIAMSERIKIEMKKQREPQQTGEVTLATTDSLDKLRGLGNIDAIFVDCSFMLSKSKKEEIYNTCFYMKKEDKPFFFIFVQ